MGNSGSNISSNLLSKAENEEHDGKTLLDELLEENQRLQAELSAIQQKAKPVASLKFDNNSPELGEELIVAQSGISDYDDVKEIPSLVAPQVNTFTFADRHKEITLEGVVRALTEILKEFVDNRGILGMRNHSKNINFTFKRITAAIKKVSSKLEWLYDEHIYREASESDAMKTAMYFSHRRQEYTIEVEPMNPRYLCVPEGDLIKFQNTLDKFCNDVISHCKRRFPTLKLSESDGSLAFLLSHYLRIEWDVLSFQMRTAMRKLNKYDPVLEKSSFLQTTIPLVQNKSSVNKYSQEVSNIQDHIEGELSKNGEGDEKGLLVEIFSLRCLSEELLFIEYDKTSSYKPHSYLHRGFGSLDWVLEVLFQQELNRSYGIQDSEELIRQIKQVKRFIRY